MWSHAMVFFASFSEISLASEEMRVMNSTQHSIRRSRASLAKATPADGGRISVTIFWTVAVWHVSLKFSVKVGARDAPQERASLEGGVTYPWARTSHRCLVKSCQHFRFKSQAERTPKDTQTIYTPVLHTERHVGCEEVQ